MKQILQIILAGDHEDDCQFFREAVAAVRVKTLVKQVRDDKQLMEYLHRCVMKLPHILFLDADLPAMGAMESLALIRSDQKFRELAIGIYAGRETGDEIAEEAFVLGANIFMNKPDNLSEMQSTLAHIIYLFWQYHTSPLKKENFLLNIRRPKINGYRKDL